MIWIVAAITVVTIFFLINYISCKTIAKITEQIRSIKLSDLESSSLDLFYDNLFHGNLKNLIEILIEIKQPKNKFLLNFRYTSLLRNCQKRIHLIEALMIKYMFEINRLKKDDKFKLLKILSPFADKYESENLNLLIRVLNSSQGLRLLLKWCMLEGKDIDNWKKFHEKWKYSEVFREHEISGMNEKYQYMAIFLYQKSEEGDFKEQLKKLLIDLINIKGLQFKNLVSNADKYLSMEGRLMTGLYQSVFQNLEAGDESDELNNDKFEKLDLNLDIPHDISDQEMIEQGSVQQEMLNIQVSHKTNENTFFEDLESWQSYVERFDETPFKAIQGKKGDSSRVLKSKYKLAIIEHSQNANFDLFRIEEAWNVIEDIQSKGMFN